MITLLVVATFLIAQPLLPVLTLGFVDETTFTPFDTAYSSLGYFLSSGWYSKSSIVFSYIYVGKLVVSWFLIVWLRLNLMRYRFDQVASYTWHELVVYSIAILVEIVVAYYVL